MGEMIEKLDDQGGLPGGRIGPRNVKGAGNGQKEISGRGKSCAPCLAFSVTVSLCYLHPEWP